jgi:hypothetical protein
LILPENAARVANFSGAFNASYVYQIRQHLNQNDHLTPLYPEVWPV